MRARPLEVIIEHPISLGLAVMASRHHCDQGVEDELFSTAHHGIHTAIQTLQDEGGYVRTTRTGFTRGELTIDSVHHEAVAGHDQLLRLHSHLVVQPVTAAGDQVHLPSVARSAASAQIRSIDATATALQAAGIDMERSHTPAGRELAAFHDHARRIRRMMTCSPVVDVCQQLMPLERHDTARAAG